MAKQNRISSRDILDQAAAEARNQTDPVRKGKSLFAIFHTLKSDEEKIPLATEILDLAASPSGGQLASIAHSIRRFVAGAELRRVDALEGAERDAQIKRASDAIQAHPDQQERVSLLVELSKKVDA